MYRTAIRSRIRSGIVSHVYSPSGIGSIQFIPICITEIVFVLGCIFTLYIFSSWVRKVYSLCRFYPYTVDVYVGSYHVQDRDTFGNMLRDFFWSIVL